MSLNININSYLKLLKNESSAEQRYYQEKNDITKFFYKLFKHPRDKRRELLYLDSIDDESFYQLFSAYTIGSELLTIPDCLNEDIMNYGSIEDLFNDRVKIMKDRLPFKHEAAIHFKDKDCNFVKESLLAFQEKFSNPNIF